MKNIFATIKKSLFICGLSAAVFSVGACTEEVIEPVFPQKESALIQFNDLKTTHELSFTANMSWELASSAVWLKFKDENDDDVPSLIGEAGDVTVSLVATSEGQEFEGNDLALVSLTMGNETMVLAEATRTPKGYEFKVLDAEGKTAEYLEVGYEEPIAFTLNSNFDFYVASKPDWIQFKGNLTTAKAGEVKEAVRVIPDDDFKKYSVEPTDENVVVFASNDGNAFYQVRLSYAGMPDSLVIVKSDFAPEWDVDMSGKKFIQEMTSPSGSETSSRIFADALPSEVLARNDEFRLFFVEEWSNSMTGTVGYDELTPESSWMHIANDKGNLTLTVDPAETSRTGHIFVFSAAQYKKLDFENKGVDALLDENGELNPAMMENILFSLHQKPAGGANAFNIVNGMLQPIEDTYEKTTGDYGTTEAYLLRTDLTWFLVDPFLPLYDDMTGDPFYTATDLEFNPLDPEAVTLEPQGNFLGISINIPTSFIITFTQDGMPMKVLVVEPKTFE